MLRLKAMLGRADTMLGGPDVTKNGCVVRQIDWKRLLESIIIVECKKLRLKGMLRRLNMMLGEQDVAKE